MDEAAPDAGPAAEKKRPLLRRIPTPLIVTLLGIALTAWLLPAFTRQWDDRQKAHELKTAMVADMASASAHALTGGDAIWAGRNVNKEAVADAWSVANLQLDARLHAYFNPRIVTAWQLYAWFVDRFDNGYRVQAEDGLLVASGWAGGNAFDLEPPAARWVGALLVTGRDGIRGTDLIFAARRVSGHPATFEGSALQELASVVHNHMTFFENRFSRDARTIEALLYELEKEIAREVLADHVAGYSTTYHDLIADLTP
jgi:hypothetical protein